MKLLLLLWLSSSIQGEAPAQCDNQLSQEQLFCIVKTVFGVIAQTSHGLGFFIWTRVLILTFHWLYTGQTLLTAGLFPTPFDTNIQVWIQRLLWQQPNLTTTGVSTKVTKLPPATGWFSFGPKQAGTKQQATTTQGINEKIEICHLDCCFIICHAFCYNYLYGQGILQECLRRWAGSHLYPC